MIINTYFIINAVNAAGEVTATVRNTWGLNLSFVWRKDSVTMLVEKGSVSIYHMLLYEELSRVKISTRDVIMKKAIELVRMIDLNPASKIED